MSWQKNRGLVVVSWRDIFIPLFHEKRENLKNKEDNKNKFHGLESVCFVCDCLENIVNYW